MENIEAKQNRMGNGIHEESRKRKVEKAAGKSILAALVLLVVVFGRHPVVGESMEPSYHDGQTVFTVRELFRPSKGDVVVAYSSDLSELLIKRVAAGPGDTLEITADGRVYVNGDEYTYGVGSGISQSMDTMQPTEDGGYQIEIGKGQYFLMGDNREHSADSRHLGTFSRWELIEKVIGAR